LQVRAAIDVDPLHVAGAHVVAPEYWRQAPAPSQVPSPPQVIAP
jgi:hypothetical protein